MTLTRTRMAAVVFGAALTLLAGGCQPFHSAQRSTSTSEPAGSEANPDANKLLSDAIKTARATQSAHLLFSSTKVADLLAKAYAADVTVTPSSAARGNATLKINGEYSQAEFHTVDAILWVQGPAGAFVNAGPARGTLDPAALLDPQRGLCSMLAAVVSPVIVDLKAHSGPDEAVKVNGTLPASAAGVLVPQISLGDAAELPVALWLAPQPAHPLLQLIVTVGSGSLTLRIDKAEPFTISAG